jgi:uncharacterized protein (TIGR01244 family)
MLAVFLLISQLLVPALPVPNELDCGVEPIAPTAAEAPVLAAFNQRIEAYMQIHNDVERLLAPPRLFDDPEDLFSATAAMQSGIRQARADARPGAMFTADVAMVIRTRLQARLAACHQRVEDVLAFINEERLPGARRPAINKRFPWDLGSAMWPSLLAALPVLPEELQYRFADRDLVLIDTHADMVVDILVQALPAPAAPQTDVSRTSVPGVINFGYIGKTVACAGATAPAALAAVRKLGYAAVINLRVATEPGAEIEASAAAAKAAGLQFIHLPFNANSPDPKLVDRFIAAVTDPRNQPVFIHCASANRAAALWMVKRMVVDKWDAERAAHEATELGLSSPALKTYAIEQARAYRSR